jgi:high-affinity iron transporter
MWNSSAILDDSSTLGSLVATLTGYRAHPALMNLLAYAVYWAVVYLLVRRANRKPMQQAAGRAA